VKQKKGKKKKTPVRKSPRFKKHQKKGEKRRKKVLERTGETAGGKVVYFLPEDVFPPGPKGKGEAEGAKEELGIGKRVKGMRRERGG